MTIRDALRRGWQRVSHSKRIILAAWLLNACAAFIVTMPLYIRLEASIGSSTQEESLSRQLDERWFRTFRVDMENSEVSSLFDYTILGVGSFYKHGEAVLNGAVVGRIGGFLRDLMFSYSFRGSPFDIMTMIALLYGVISVFLSGGFIGVYADRSAGSLSDFVAAGARFFGRFARLALLTLLVYYLFFVLVLDVLSAQIPAWTSNDPSEQTAFTYYMIRNVLALAGLALLGMLSDYAKIRIAVEDRYSVVIASAASVLFIAPRILRTIGLYLLLALAGILLIALFGAGEALTPWGTTRGLVLLIILQQAYMVLRIGLRAMFYASQTEFFSGSTPS